MTPRKKKEIYMITNTNKTEREYVEAQLAEAGWTDFYWVTADFYHSELAVSDASAHGLLLWNGYAYFMVQPVGQDYFCICAKGLAAVHALHDLKNAEHEWKQRQLREKKWSGDRQLAPKQTTQPYIPPIMPYDEIIAIIKSALYDTARWYALEDYTIIMNGSSQATADTFVLKRNLATCAQFIPFIPYSYRAGDGGHYFIIATIGKQDADAIVAYVQSQIGTDITPLYPNDAQACDYIDDSANECTYIDPEKLMQLTSLNFDSDSVDRNGFGIEDEVIDNCDDVELIVINLFDEQFAVREWVSTNINVQQRPWSGCMYTITDPRLVGLLPSKAIYIDGNSVGTAQLLMTFYYNKSLPAAARALGKSQPSVIAIAQSAGDQLSYNKNLRIFVDNQATSNGVLINVIVFGDDQKAALFANASDERA